MASTYALPVASTSNSSHSHGRTRSQYAPDPALHANNALSASPARENGHRHSHSEMNGHGQLHGAVRSPYAEYNSHAHSHNHSHSHDHSHAHSHSHSHSNDSTHTLKPFPNGRTNGVVRGDMSLGGSPQRKGASARKFGFSPIQESAPHPPPSAASSSWLELPEALTALLIPLPYLFSTVAYPGIASLTFDLPTTLSEAVADSSPPIEIPQAARASPLQHALALSAATLLVVGTAGRINSTLQPLDRRKEGVGVVDTKAVPLRALTGTASILLPFYAATQLGGAKTALVLLLATAAGIGGLEQKPGKHTTWSSIQRTLKTRKYMFGVLLLGTIVDTFATTFNASVLLGHVALWTSILLAPPPLPTLERSISIKITSSTEDSYLNQDQSRATLPKPLSSLVNSPENALATIASGLFLTLVTVLYSYFSASALPHTLYTGMFFVLSIASATALLFFSHPSALKNPKLNGLKLGGLMIAGFGFWERYHSSGHALAFLWTCAISVGALVFETKAPTLTGSHAHDHSHAGHQHAHGHDHGHHHLHGNHSRLSAFLIARATPGSIIHSVLIERDSRRIAYFGVLNLSFMMVQFFYGFVSGSLGLLTDSIHMLFDCAGLAVGLAAAVMSKWRPNARFPYGYGKIDTLSGFANGVFLLLVSVEIIFDAFERLWEGHELQRLNELLIVSVLGFLVNIVGLTAFGHAHHGHGHSHDHGDHDHGHSHSHDNENMQGIFLHILADALGSVAVIVSTLLTKYYGWSGWDPIASCIIAILIFLSAIPLVKSSGARLMLSLPNDIEYGVRDTLGELGTLRGVVGYTVPRFWLEDEGAAHAEAHAKEECDHDHDHDHDHHSHDHSHSSHNQSHSHSHSHDHSHDRAHPSKQKILGVIHIIATRAADLEDVRERTVQFLKGRGMDVVVHVEHEGEGRCWCGGGLKSN